MDRIQVHSNNEVITDPAMVLRNAKKNIEGDVIYNIGNIQKRTAMASPDKAMKQTTLSAQKFADLASTSSKGLKWNSNEVPSQIKKKVSTKEMTFLHATQSQSRKKATVLNLSPEHGGNIILAMNEDNHSFVVACKKDFHNTSGATSSSKCVEHSTNASKINLEHLNDAVLQPLLVNNLGLSDSNILVYSGSASNIESSVGAMEVAVSSVVGGMTVQEEGTMFNDKLPMCDKADPDQNKDKLALPQAEGASDGNDTVKQQSIDVDLGSSDLQYCEVNVFHGYIDVVDITQYTFLGLH
jgi:hypothetical protein